MSKNLLTGFQESRSFTAPDGSPATMVGGIPVRGQVEAKTHTGRADRTKAVLGLRECRKWRKAQVEDAVRKGQHVTEGDIALSRKQTDAVMAFQRHGDVRNALAIMDNGYPMVETRDDLTDLLVCHLDDVSLSAMIESVGHVGDTIVVNFKREMAEEDRFTVASLIEGTTCEWPTAKRLQFSADGVGFDEEGKMKTTDGAPPSGYTPEPDTLPTNTDDSEDDRTQKAADPGTDDSKTGDVGPSSKTQEN